MRFRDACERAIMTVGFGQKVRLPKKKEKNPSFVVCVSRDEACVSSRLFRDVALSQLSFLFCANIAERHLFLHMSRGNASFHGCCVVVPSTLPLPPPLFFRSPALVLLPPKGVLFPFYFLFHTQKKSSILWIPLSITLDFWVNFPLRAPPPDSGVSGFFLVGHLFGTLPRERDAVRKFTSPSPYHPQFLF